MTDAEQFALDSMIQRIQSVSFESTEYAITEARAMASRMREQKFVIQANQLDHICDLACLWKIKIKPAQLAKDIAHVLNERSDGTPPDDFLENLIRQILEVRIFNKKD